MIEGGHIVNIFSEFLKQKSLETQIPYNVLIVKFWKDKKLQDEWKDYKNGIIKEILVPRKMLLPFGRAPKIAPVSVPVETKIIKVRKGRPPKLTIPTPPKTFEPKPSSRPKIKMPSWSEMPKTPTAEEAEQLIAEPEFPQLSPLSSLKSFSPLSGLSSIEGTGASLVRMDYPPLVRKFLKQRGNEVVETMMIGRTPLDKATNLLLNSVTRLSMGGVFQKRQKKMGYDDLFHLELIITTTTGTRFSIEKNEVINVRVNPSLKLNTQTKEIDRSTIPPNLTISEMLDKTLASVGKSKMFLYNAVTNNCQDFIMAILNANGIGSESDRAFVKQETAELFKGARKTASFAHLLTTIAAVKNRIIEGEGLYKVQSVLFDRKKWDDPSKASEWLKSHSYKDAGVDIKEDTYRFRQLNPSYVKSKGFKRFITKPLGDSGVSLILAYK